MYSPILVVHIAAGIVSLLSGFCALLVRKGSRLHRRSGNVFVPSMLVMAVSGSYVALTHGQRFNVLSGLLTFYLVATAWLTVKRRTNETGRVEYGLLLFGLAAGVTAGIFAWQTPRPGLAVGYSIFASVLVLSVAGDVRMLVRGGVSGAQRLARHLWRMCIGLFITAGSFFLGMSGDPVLRTAGLRARLFPKEIRDTHLPAVPVVIILVLMVFWLFRVLLTNAYKKPEQAADTR